MPIPEPERVLYQHCPLVEVTSQLSFPAILRIDSEPPVDFQDKVRDAYPFYTRPRVQPKPTSRANEVRVMEIGREVGSSGGHQFESADRLWRFKLSQASALLATRAYGRWEDFRRRLGEPYQAFRDSYRPAFFTHLCLRYKNVIRREAIGRDQTPWSELIERWAAGPLADTRFGAETEGTYSRYTIAAGGGVVIDATLGLAAEEPSKRKVFAIEAHVFTNERTEPHDVLGRLDGIHRHAHAFFRSCITEHLHLALAPAPVGRG